MFSRELAEPFSALGAVCIRALRMFLRSRDPFAAPRTAGRRRFQRVDGGHHLQKRGLFLQEEILEGGRDVVARLVRVQIGRLLAREDIARDRGVRVICARTRCRAIPHGWICFSFRNRLRRLFERGTGREVQLPSAAMCRVYC